VEEDSNAKITYFDFLVRVIDVNNDIDEEDIQKAFRQLDTDNSGKITEGCLKKFLQRKGEYWTDVRASMILNQVDLDERRECTHFKWNSGLEDDQDNSRDGIGYNTFKDYILNKSVNHSSWRKLVKQPTCTFFNLNNQATIDDEKSGLEMKAWSTYLKNYEQRHSSFKFSVSSTG